MIQICLMMFTFTLFSYGVNFIDDSDLDFIPQSLFMLTTLLFLIFFIVNHSYLVIPLILYFVIGYIFCLNYFPKIKQSNVNFEIDSDRGVCLIFDIIFFWIIIAIVICSYKIIKLLSKIIKNPMDEWRKENNK